ncbi:protein of unknown function [Blastococcus aggregatus]|uniref:DUF222 domain-containing protein n=1 Tax=Blastococcus aggregatus TaxID=38502 RepID=A0A285UZN4_9ACTN|nr:HNH endonuclease signature motif containing protein [Blastococcus aggregatus]SOC47344.1 protein of unknown function [Blastococcus aggregatus]
MKDGATTGEPTAGWASGALGAVQAADREISRQTAVRARGVAAFAATRPASDDRPAGQPGSMSEERRAARPAVLADASEWAGQELALALEISGQAAETLLERSLTLVHRLPRTLEALESGALHVGHLFPMLERVGPIADDAKRAEVEAKLLAWMAGRVTTPAQLTDKARRLGLLVDARDSARRLVKAVRRRGVHVRPDREDGMAQAVALLTVPEAAALVDALGRYADALDEPGDERTRSQKMADCLLDLVLRPGETGMAPVQAHLTVVAAVSTLLGGDQPGEIAGQVVPAELVRALARALGLLPDEDGAVDEAESPAEAEPPTELALPDDQAEPDQAEPGGASPLERALEEWWRDVERRALTEEWGTGRRPVLEYEPVHHAGRRRPQAPAPPGSPAIREPSTSADSAVTAAGLALLGFDRALGRACTAVRRAELTGAADEAAWRRSPAGRASAAGDALQSLREAGDEQRAALARLLDATAGGGLAERPRIAVVDALGGALLALTDSRGLRRGAGLGPPPPTAGYRPGAALDRYLRARDRRCRLPGCRRPVPRGGELDHSRPWPDGPTSAANLAGYCTPHHRGKHQAPGWRHELAADGTLTVTTPSGLRATSAPPPF